MNASTFFKSTTLVLALMGTMTCCANQSKKNAETEATTDKFESADWQLYNLRGKVKSCTESKVMAELVGTDQLKAMDEEPIVQEMKFDESGWLLSNNYYRRSTTSRKAAEYGYNPNDAEVVVKVKRNDKSYITEFEGTHKKFGEDYDGHFRIANSFDDHGNLTTSEYIGWEWSTTTNYKYDTQDVYAEIEQQFSGLRREHQGNSHGESHRDGCPRQLDQSIPVLQEYPGNRKSRERREGHLQRR